MPRIQLRQWIVCVCIIVLAVLHGALIQDTPQARAVQKIQAISQWPVAPIPVRDASVREPSLSAISAYVTDESSGAVLHSKNAVEQFPPASATKLMTALIAREQYAAGSTFTTPARLTGLDGRVLWNANTRYSLESVLATALIPSGNEAAWLLAASYPEGEQAFVTAMNARANALGLKQTTFANAIGFDHPDQRSTARDLTILAREVLKDPMLRRLVRSSTYTIVDLDTNTSATLTNTNQLLGNDERVRGMKTGTTAEAGQVLVTLANLGGNDVIITVLGSVDRYQDTVVLMNWLETAYTWNADFESSRSRVTDDAILTRN